MKNKFIKSLLCISMALMMTIGFNFNLSSLPDTSIVAHAATITSLYDNATASINQTGTCTIRGKINPNGGSVALIVVTDNGLQKFKSNNTGSLSVPEDVVMIVQTDNVGSTGEYLFTFAIPSELAFKTIHVLMGTNDPSITDGGINGNTLKIDVPNIQLKLIEIKNQSVRIGNDIYALDSNYYTRERVVASLKKGNNVIWYKVGNYWYNLLDEDCLSNEYLKSANSLKNSILEKFMFGVYYSSGSTTYPDLDDLPNDYYD